MYKWIKKIHTYAGLLSFTAFVVWGITGIYAILLPPPGGQGAPEVSEQRQIAFAAPGNLDDPALARLILEVAEIPMATSPVNVHRDENHKLAFVVYTVNGRWDATYMDQEERILVEARRNDLWGFLSSMHAGHPRRGSPDLPARLWGFYNEFSTWAFLFMSLSGAYLWLATRPALPWAQVLAGSAAAFFVILWLITR